MTYPHLRRRWDKLDRTLSFQATNRKEWSAWRRRLRRKLRELIGYNTFERTAPKAVITEQHDFGDYVRQRVEIHTESDVIMPFYVLIPRLGKTVYPAVICPHGHGSGGKAAVVGERKTPAHSDAIKRYNYDYGVQYARAGFMTFCPDARGFGERQETLALSAPLDSSCRWINNMAYPLGQTITGMWAWDLHRLVDYIGTRKDCLPGKVGCAGLSGGGLQTLWAAALDDRIRCAVVSGYFYGYKESLIDLHGNCSCNYVPHLYEYADMGDIGALIAPRPLLIETGDRDNLNGPSGLRNVRSQTRIARAAYRLLDAGKAFRHHVFHGEHRWNGTEAIPWMQRLMRVEKTGRAG